MKEKQTAKKRGRNAQPESVPETKTEALNHQQEKLIQWFREVKFRKVLFGGVDESSVWKKLEELEQIYEASLSAERARYDALLAEHQKNCNAVIRKYKKLAEGRNTGQEDGEEKTDGSGEEVRR